MQAQRAAEFARGSAAGRKFDPAQTGAAIRADDVAFFHAVMIPPDDNRSTTTALSSAAGREAMRSTLMLRLDVGCMGRRVRLFDRIDPGLEIGRSFDQGSGEFRICGGFGVPEKRCRLARKVSSAQHV
ncbi:MAG TPA: hypothetical protein VKR55_29010 [Bradyrhizobium sp.]|uniref:hypothetical protein n=1 Tax=Bradyrhizobium sp. TaxID=376 RepID=UPI002CA94472|nr:hypothetical protein [Bradyrhizobium sp.]HLZ06177.1 hypothetical protein [Bradyrhizobium sp.]